MAEYTVAIFVVGGVWFDRDFLLFQNAVGTWGVGRGFSTTLSYTGMQATVTVPVAYAALHQKVYV